MNISVQSLCNIILDLSKSIYHQQSILLMMTDIEMTLINFNESNP